MTGIRPDAWARLYPPRPPREPRYRGAHRRPSRRAGLVRVLTQPRKDRV